MPTTMPTAQEIVDMFVPALDAFGLDPGSDIIVTVLLAKRAPGVDGPLANENEMAVAFQALTSVGTATFGEGNVKALQVTVATEPETTVGDVTEIVLGQPTGGEG